MLLREERHLLRSRRILLAEQLHRLAPRRFLPPVEFAQVKHVPLDDAIPATTPIFHDAPVEVLFAIFAAL